MAEKIKVLIVEDSMSMRMFLREILSKAPDMEVIGMAENPFEAKDIINKQTPNVITLDVEMPRMDGVSFLEKLMKMKPVPVVMISTLTHKGSRIAMQALEIGAVDVIGKPSQSASEMKTQAEAIVEKVRAAAYANVGQKQKLTPPSNAALKTLQVTPTLLIDDVYPKKGTPPTSADPLIAIGASTGGPDALRTIFRDLPTGLPPIVIVQHMSAGFTKPLANSLDKLSKINVVEAEENMPLKRGHAYIAPAKQHLVVQRKSSGEYVSKLLQLDPVNRHRPAVDIMFRSVVGAAGSAAYAFVLTGMGDDGARCLKELKEIGAMTIAQDEASSTVYGMPKAAAARDAANKIMSLSQITNYIKDLAS